MEQLRRQQQAQSQRLYLLLQNLQLQQLLQQKKTRHTQSTNISPLLQQEILLPQPSVPILQTNLSTIQQPVNPLFQQQPTIIFQQQQTTPQFYQPQTYSFQHQPMTVQQLFTLTQPSFTVQPLITHQAPSSTPLKCEQSQSLPQDVSYYLVKDANIHKEAFKEALKLPINEQKRHPPPGEPVIPVHALKVEGSDTASQVQLHHQFKQNCQ